MVEATRELEYALGLPIKKVEDNEMETSIVQRRCCRATKDIEAGELILEDFIEVLRPAPVNSIAPFDKDKICGKKAAEFIPMGDFFSYDKIM